MARTKGSNSKTKVERLKEHRQVARYDQAAINQCWRLYLQNNGQNHERIAAEMRKEYPGFQAARVADWATKYAWQAGLKLVIDQHRRFALTSAETLTNDIEAMLERLKLEIEKAGAFDKELFQLFRDFCRLKQEQLTKVQPARDTLGAFVAFWERQLAWLKDYSPHAAEALLQVEEQILKRAAEEYAESEQAESADR